mmetsp:Transcript_46092/g.55886  ORF Transcript_46092/g.55886 Transcript_46092/m.55886 type:complete len:653 (+) Transcript_46092:226-2184(+)|eukprot:CAMPEP_0172495152 /NCGR_PEP_ID=MMETSP1066-20121228/64177_1 /TAXON_ID=671091 /ORGANISM="Coscinodiscus wailesii, Strain CCMP2513" /LENGTH=652 /DNA_ID=CAMNT_0013266639 /DNA_START=216 /DNA_END=2174 /DNA_ORIENTATION=-
MSDSSPGGVAPPDEAETAAILEYVSSFPNLSGPPPTELSELGDGVALFEMLAEIAPSHFDPTTIARHLGDNWALKSSNIRKLLRNLETYYHEVLYKDADFEPCVDAIPDISRHNSPLAIVALFELIVGAAVICEHKEEFVQRMLVMSEQSQANMKEIVERSLARQEDYEFEEGEINERDLEDDTMVFTMAGDDESYNFGMDVNGMNMSNMATPSPYRPGFAQDANSLSSPPGTSGLFHSAMNDLSDHKDRFATPNDMSAFSPADILKERDELRRALQEVRRELAAQMSQSEINQQESEAAHKKLVTLADDLQERLGKRQEELTDAEDEINRLKLQLEDSHNNNADLKSKYANMADEMDLANAKIAQLRKAEATVLAYRKKLDNAGLISQQMADLEDQAANYYRQVVHLEKEAKQLPVLNKRIEQLQDQYNKLESETNIIKEQLQTKNNDIIQLKDQLRESEKHKTQYETELTELRNDNATGTIDISNEDSVDDSLKDCYNALTSAQSIKDVKEKSLRLEMENKRLTDQINELHTSAAGEQTSSEDERALKASITRLKDELKKRDMEKEKLTVEKEKLEAYTKRTLAKFQEKYLVALQECKAKLKEKHDKIEQLENRSTAEKNAQKREERLLSSTIYELGLAIMQQKLKERQG